MAKSDIFGVKARQYPRRIIMTRGYLYDTMGLLTKKERSFLDFLLKYMDEDMNTITLSGETREKCMEETGLASKSVSNMLSILKSKGFIDKILLPNEYIIDPRLAFKGSEFLVYKYYLAMEKELRKHRGVILI